MYRFILTILIVICLYSPVYAQPVAVYSDCSNITGCVPNAITASSSAVLSNKSFSDNVGIGTVNPTENLQIANNGKFGGTNSESISSTTGAITFCGTGKINNECVRMDMETDADRVSFNPTSTEITSVNIPMILKTDRIMSGGVDQLTYNIDQGGVTDGLVAYYKMEDNTASTAVIDEVGVNNGVATVNTTELSTTGKLNNGFSLTSSSSEYIDLGSDSSLKFTGDFTVSFWINTSTTGSTMRILGNRSASGTNTGWEVFINSGGIAGMQVDTPAGLVSVTGSTNVADGVWRQVIAKRSGSILSFKINNVAEGSPTGSSTGDCGTDADNTYIGRTPQTAQYYNGKIDNLRIFDRALTDAEDTILYNAGNGNEDNGSGSTVVSLKMEDNAASTDVTDTTGLNTVTSTTNTSNLTTTGLLGNGFNFNGSSEYLDLGSAAALKFTEDFTVNVWVRLNSAGVQRIAGNRSSSGDNVGWDLSKTSGGSATFILDEGAVSYSVTATTSIIDSAWHMLTIKRSGSTLSIFIDGVSEGTPTGSSTADIGTLAENTYVGRTPFSANYFSGDMDSYTAFNRAISDDEIAILYNGGRGTDSLTGSTTQLVHMFSSTKIGAPVYDQITSANDVFIGDDLEVDGDLYVDTKAIVMGNVGIGTLTASAPLHVVGTVMATSFTGDGSGLTGISGGGGVGIGTTNTITFWPTTTTIGSLSTTTYPSLTELSYVKGVTSDIQTQINGLSIGSGGWADGGTNVYNTSTSDFVGIGTTTPKSALNIIGNVGIGTVTPSAALSIGNSPAFIVTSGGTTTITSANTASAVVTVAANSLSSSQALTVSNSNTAYTGSLGNFSLSGSSTAVSGSALQASVTGASSTNARVFNAADSSNDTTPFMIQAVTGNVGVGTFIPTSQVDIRTQARTPFKIGNSATDSTGGYMIVDSTGNVGIGSVSPATKLSVVGTISATAFTGDGSALTGISGGASGWTDSGTNVFPTTTSDKVAIGTTTPVSGAILTVNGTLAGGGSGPMAITNANVGIGTTTAGSLLTVGSTGQFTVDTSGNTRVGIGTTTAGTIICVKSISGATATLGYCTGSLTNSICGTCN